MRRVVAWTGCILVLWIGTGCGGRRLGGAGTNGGADVTAPVMTAPEVLTDDVGNALVVWGTNEPSTASVAYGVTAEYGNTVTDALPTSWHVVGITGLPQGTTVHFQVTSTDGAGNESQSGDLVFVQGTTGNALMPPYVDDLEVEAGTNGTATVRWTTNKLATASVSFGATPQHGTTVSSGGPLATEHEVVLTGLATGESVHYSVQSTDAYELSVASPDATFYLPADPAGGASVSGTLRVWYPVTLSFEGPFASELDDSPNPFLDHRLTVRCTGPSGQVLDVPGFFDGDGSGGGSGDVWRARFVPDEPGEWSWVASFVTGVDVAVSLDPDAGSPAAFDGASGTVDVAPRDPAAPGFHKWGRLEYTGGHYLRFRDGPWFLKGGTDSPENFLAYKGFDNTVDQPGGPSTFGLENGIHRYLPHVDDFGPTGLGDVSDPVFASEDTGYDSRGIVGALNYLASRGVNSIYFLPMNLGGDGRDVHPFVGATDDAYDKTHYDVSKLRQWGLVLDHAQRRGILLHFVLAETEWQNEYWLDDAVLGVERRLYYRELVARFGHSLALKWNLSEENDYPQEELEAFADYIRAVDPYDHVVAFHTHVLPSDGSYPDYEGVLGDPRFSAASLQGHPGDAGDQVELWRELSAAAGHPWVVESDEQTGGLSDANADELRKAVLYDVYFSGGHVEWYAGYHPLPVGGDLRMEDFRTREEMWDYTAWARGFLEEHLPFWEMGPADELVSGEAAAYGGAEVFAKAGEVYAVYFPDASQTGTLDLGSATGSLRKRWFDPRSGTFQGTQQLVTGGGAHPVGAPPSAPSEDWVLLVER